MLNTGSTYRVGPHRLYVALARQLAAKGFSCLRMDLCGLGDSITPDKERENDPYPATAFRDIDRTLECLHTRFGTKRVVLMGLCSGAYAAFQAAAQLASPCLIESVLINPATFHWREGMSLTWESSPAVRIQSLQPYFNAVWHPRKWLKLLSGRSTLGMVGAVNMFVERCKLKMLSCDHGQRCGVAAADGSPSHPRGKDLPGDLQRITESRRHLAFFFARSDPGYDSLIFYARRKVKALRKAGWMDVHFIDGADHTFSCRTPRQTLIEAITEHLCRRYQA
jgi:pimeloyl-ACP methyl ester carboxylesterase